MLYLHIMEIRLVYSAPVMELSEFQGEYLICNSPDGQNEDYNGGQFDW